jgi:hypothetical protein
MLSVLTVAAAKTAVSARREKRKTVKRETISFDSDDRITGDRPEHVHRNHNPDAKVKEWACNSPYCEDLTGPHPKDGGYEPIIQGREPWRGGNR